MLAARRLLATIRGTNRNMTAVPGVLEVPDSSLLLQRQHNVQDGCVLELVHVSLVVTAQATQQGCCMKDLVMQQKPHQCKQETSWHMHVEHAKSKKRKKSQGLSSAVMTHH